MTYQTSKGWSFRKGSSYKFKKPEILKKRHIGMVLKKGRQDRDEIHEALLTNIMYIIPILLPR